MRPDAPSIDNPGGKPVAVNFSGWPSGSLAAKASDTVPLTSVFWLNG